MSVARRDKDALKLLSSRQTTEQAVLAFASQSNPSYAETPDRVESGNDCVQADPLVAVLATSPAFAVNCKSGGETQADMNDCAGQDFKASGVAMNKRYAVVRSCLDETGKEKLFEAQTAWLKLRDAECELQSSASEGGSVHPMAKAICLTQETNKRSNSLNYYLTCEEGDMNCPTPRCNSK